MPVYETKFLSHSQKSESEPVQLRQLTYERYSKLFLIEVAKPEPVTDTSNEVKLDELENPYISAEQSTDVDVIPDDLEA